MAYPSLNRKINFPTPLEKNPDKSGNVFPSDLVTGKGFYTQIEIVDYHISQQFNGLGNVATITNPNSSIKLPIPQRLNDSLILQWSTPSFTDKLLSGGSNMAQSIGNAVGLGGLTSLGVSALSLGAALGGIGSGQALNPLMFLQFQRPEFRSFSLSWILAPNNKQESFAIRKIITKFKKAASPERNGFLMSYPQVVMIKMQPNDLYGHMVFKPCIINSVQANYSAGPVPSFYKTGAPAIVSLTLNLTEMQFWFRSEIK